MKKSGLFLASILLYGGAVQAQAPMALTLKRLTLSTAQHIAQVAIDTCRAKGIQVAVTVVDRDGVPQVVLRDTLAPPIAVKISRGKAYAAAMFNVPTSELGARANTPIGRVPGLVMSAGAVPIHAGGFLLGAVGVSGAPSGTTDQQCARAGVDAVQADLEMSL